MLEIQSITIKYAVCEVVKNITFSLQDGEIVALLGANGAGKTTLLRSLNATLPVSNGRILLDNKNLCEFSRREIAQKIAVVAQENETKFPVTTLEFILGGGFAHGKAFGFETEKDLAFASKALEICDLQGFENRPIKEFSPVSPTLWLKQFVGVRRPKVRSSDDFQILVNRIFPML